MAIVKMTSFELLTLSNHSAALLKALQKFNYVHFDNIREKLGEEDLKVRDERIPGDLSRVTEDLDRVRNAIKLLYSFDTRPGGIKGLMEGNPTLDYENLETAVRESGWEETYEKVRAISDVMDELKLRETRVRGQLEEIDSWTGLDAIPSEIYRLEKVQSVLGSIPKKFDDTLRRELLDLKLTYIEKIGESRNDFFYMILTDPSEEEEVMEILRKNAFSQSRPEFDEKPLEVKKRLKEEILQLKRDENAEREKLRALGSEIPKLEIAEEYLENLKKRIGARENFINTERVSIISGFIPDSRKEEFTGYVREAAGPDAVLTFSEVDKDNPDVPVLLKNNKFVSAFESITDMYSLPKYNEIDPTPFLTPFYLFFFGMMIGDALYGLIMLIGSWFALKKFNLSKSMRSFVRFFFYLSFPTIFWGLIYGSYMSLDVPIKGLINQETDIQLLLLLSIGLGVIHLFFGLGLKGYILLRDGKPMDAVYDVLFWYLALTSAALLLLGGVLGLPAVIVTIAKWVMIASMAGIVLFAARDTLGWGGRIAGGFYSLYGISSWIGDLVSYSRLMALGLSGAFIGKAFNMIAGMLGSAWYMLPFAALIFLGGHAFNLFLSALGAYVHTLRLTYVEFFGKFYEGGGKKFKTFRHDPKYINYSDDL